MAFTANILLGLLIASIFYYNENRHEIAYKVSARESNKKIDKKTLSSLNLQQTYNQIAQINMPAVVSLHVTTMIVNRSRQPFFEDDFFRRFFGLPEEPTTRKGQTYGTGFIISKDGYLISNHHVVENSEEIVVVFEDSDKQYKAEVIGSDKDSDVALLKITSGNNFPYVTLGNSEKIKVGDLVVAIGNPFGLSHTFTTGVVSAKGRNAIGQNKYENFIQTDVAINPGNSGGPLINIFGEVIAINSMIYSQNGGSIGIGFAIPINMAKNIVNQLKTKGKVQRGWLGVSIQDVTDEMAKDLDIEKRGVYIPEVLKASPAQKAGVKAGDIILQINGKKIIDSNDLRNKIASLMPGATITITILRRRKQIELKATINSQEDQKITYSGSNKKYLGVVVSDMNKKFLEEYNLKESFGVIIQTVDRESPFAEKGVREGDIIRMVNWQEIANIADFDKIMSKVKNKRKIIFHIQRGNYLQVVAIYP